MKKLFVLLAVMLGFSAQAFAVDFAFHGDFSNEFRLYSNQSDFFAKDEGGKIGRSAKINDDSTSDFFGVVKYRLWTEAASDDGAIKGVFAVEIGGIHYGNKDKGGSFSGDGVNIETRWAYTDFALGQGRVKVGLQPFTVNKFLWKEAATGVDYKRGNLELAWMRGYEVSNSGDNNDFKDLDAFYARYNLKPVDGAKVGLFALWQTSDGDTVSDGATAPSSNYLKKLTATDLDLYTVGVDGGLKSGKLFFNWDLMYQTGDYAEEFDFGGYFAHLDAGIKLGKGKLTYTFWYASGDDDSSDDDLDAFIATDCDTKGISSSLVLFEGYTSDNYFTAVPYLQDKGLILNRIGYDRQLTDKLKIGVAAMYLMTAEDLGNDTDADGKVDQFEDDEIGVEFDAYASYKLYKNLELAIQVGYLAAGDAMDFYEVEQDGSSDEDLYVVNSKIRYKF